MKGLGVSSEHTPDLQIHLFDHALVGFLCAAIEVVQSQIAQASRFRLIAGRFPGPVGRIEVQADEEGLAGFRGAIDGIHCAASHQVGEITQVLDGNIVIPQIIPMICTSMHVVVERAAPKAIKMIVAAFQRTEPWQDSQVPLSDQRGAISRLLEQRWQGGVAGRQPDVFGS